VQQVYSSTQRFDEYVGSGTYTLNTTVYPLNLSTTGRLGILLPNAGVWSITAEFQEDISALTASASPNYANYSAYLDGVPVLNSQRKGFGISALAGAIAGVTVKTNTYNYIVNTTIPSQLFEIRGKKLGATTGAWNVVGDTTGAARLSAQRVS
jgi:hypothetical protein